MLDINLIRERPDLVRAALLDLNAEAPIDEILVLDGRRRETLKELEASIRAEATAAQGNIKQINDAVAQLDTQLQTVDKLLSQRGKALIIESLPDLVPEGMELSGYHLSEDVMLRLTGAAKNPEVVKIFVSELVNSGLVEQPTVADPVYREGSPIFDFEITTKLRQEG